MAYDFGIGSTSIPANWGGFWGGKASKDIDALFGANSPVITLSDVLYRLMERSGAFVDDPRSVRMISRAAKDALRDIPNKHDWNYYQIEYMFRTSAQVTLTVNYSSATRTATVTSGTIPQDAELGVLYFNDIPYQVEQVVNNDIRLSPTGYPASNYVGNVIWARGIYSVPQCTKLHSLWQISNRRPLEYLSQTVLSEFAQSHRYPGTSRAFTMQTDSTFGRTELRLSPPPSTAETFLVSMNVQPAKMQVERDVVEISGTLNQETFTSSSVKSKWIGSVVRINQDETSENDKIEAIKAGEFTWQALILGVSGSTGTLAVNKIPSNLTNEPAVVSSVVDIDNSVMQTYYEDLAYSYYCKNHKHDSYADAAAIAETSLMEARKSDSKVNRSDPLYGRSWPWLITNTQLGVYSG